MMAVNNPMNEKKLISLLKEGERLRLEFKRSTAELQGTSHGTSASASGTSVFKRNHGKSVDACRIRA